MDGILPLRQLPPKLRVPGDCLFRRSEWRVEVESKAATLYSLEIVPRYRKTKRDAEHEGRTDRYYTPIIRPRTQLCPNNIFAIPIYIFYGKLEFWNLGKIVEIYNRKKTSSILFYAS